MVRTTTQADDDESTTTDEVLRAYNSAALKAEDAPDFARGGTLERCVDRAAQAALENSDAHGVAFRLAHNEVYQTIHAATDAGMTPDEVAARIDRVRTELLRRE